MSLSGKLITVAKNVDRVYLAGEFYGQNRGYELGYADGLDAGFTEAYNDGFNDGYELGDANGWQRGHDEGYDEGYFEGFDVGGSTGYESGYSQGKAAGVSEGYANGYNEGEQAGYTSGLGDGFVEGKQAEYDRFWNAFQQNGTRKSYFSAFCGVCWSGETFKPKYPIKIVETSTGERYADSMFKYFMRDLKNKGYSPIKITPEIVDFSGCVNADSIFNNAWLDEVVVDFSNAQRAVSTFALGDGGGGVRKITIKLTEKATNLSNMFSYASVTEELIFTDDSVIAASLDLQKSKLLSRASFVSIANALSPSVTATLKVSKTAVDAAFPDTAEWDALFADKPNWTVTEV